ncbi:MAG: hypothetical protein NC418_02485 [Muribaculaceae bacterium]|nr:hypothetical protein [Muribaculaceae bacterium]
MNTWIISPNGWAWALLGIAAASLLIIAVCTIVQTLRTSDIRRDVTNSYIRNRNIIGKGTSGCNWIIYIWFTVGIFVLLFAILDYQDGLKIRTQESTVITVLSILVTFLVAWQIWQNIASKEEIREAHKAAENLEATRAELNKRIDEVRWLAVGFYNEHQQEKPMTPSNQFWHITRTAGAYIAANVQKDFQPLYDALNRMEHLLQSLKSDDGDIEDVALHKATERTKLSGTRKREFDEWQERAITLINTEAQHLTDAKERIRRIHRLYHQLTERG